jgi:prevent-host-death family protein
MARISASKARSDLADVLNRVAYNGERVLLHRRGKNVAAVVPVEDLAFLEELEDRLDLEDARASLAEVRKKGTIPWEKIKSALRL